MTRRRFTERQVLQVLLLQGVVILCFRCGEPITDAKESQREHLHEIALGGPDTVENCRFSHTDCHAVVTDGPKATKANSSKGRIAKAKRIVREGKMLPGKVAPPVEAHKRAWPSRKMQSRSFQPGHRPMRSRKEWRARNT